MKQMVLHICTLTLFLFCHSGYYAQNTWNWVGQDNDKKVINFGVKALSNKIFTFSSTIIWDEPVPYVKTNLLQFDYNGNIIYDSLYGNINQTFVLSEIKMNYSSGIFYLSGVTRYPANPNLGQPSTLWVIDTLYNTKLFNILPFDTGMYQGITYFDKVNENKYIYTQWQQPINNLGTISCNIVLMDSSGNIVNTKTLQKANKQLRISAFHFYENYYFAMVNSTITNNINDPTNLIIYKMDSLLNMVDSFKTTTNNWYATNSSAVFPNGDFVVGGVYSDAWEPDGDVWQKKYIRKFDKNLNIIWTKYFGMRNLNTGITKLMITSDGHIAGTGIDGLVTINTNGDTIGHITGCIYKFTADGDSVWMHNYQAIDDPLYGDNNELMDIDEMPDGGFIACGKSVAFSPYRQRGWLMRVNANGCLNPDCISSTKEIEDSNEFIVYPNPGNEILNITNSNQISFYQIFQFDGKLVERGSSFPVNIKEFTNGLYFLQINTKSNQVINQKIIKQ